MAEANFPSRRSFPAKSLDQCFPVEARCRAGREEARIYREDPYLYQAAIRHFGNWPAAQAAAGLSPGVSNEWSRERVLHELRKWHQKCEDRCVRLDSKLRAASRRYFGTVQEALTAAGLFLPLGGKKWTPNRVIAAIQDRHVQGLQIQQPYGADPPRTQQVTNSSRATGLPKS